MPDLNCPILDQGDNHISLAHGAGGKAMQDLIHKIIAPLYGAGFSPDHDSAVFKMSGKMAFTTDSYVVNPLFFPGGDIGKLAVYGTLNDLAMSGANPKYLSCSFIIEEGLPVEVLQRVCFSLATAARESGVAIVTGDTKVVGRNQADGLYINTSGIGLIAPNIDIHPKHIRPGDKLILSGDLGRHGIAVMSVREGMAFEADIVSDCAPLIAPVQALLANHLVPRCLRDLTRGGLAAALHELAVGANLGFEVHEQQIPVHPTVRGACEILGLDPIYIANEGRFLAIVPENDVDQTLKILNSFDCSSAAVVIGSAKNGLDVELVGPYGTRRLLPVLRGELLPRIC